MKSPFAFAIAFVFATAAVGAHPATAQEPFELTSAELDRVTGAGRITPVDTVSIDYEVDPSSDELLELHFSLRVRSPGTEVSMDNGWFVTPPTITVRGD